MKHCRCPDVVCVTVIVEHRIPRQVKSDKCEIKVYCRQKTGGPEENFTHEAVWVET